MTFNGLHAVICEKIELFITTAVRTSNPTPSEFILHKAIIIRVYPRNTHY
jgi:hypothetical protein